MKKGEREGGRVEGRERGGKGERGREGGWGHLSLVPRPQEEEKGPGFSHLHMRLIAVEFHRFRILLIYFRTLVIVTKRYSVRTFITAAYVV